MQGRVTSVVENDLGTELAADATAGTTVLDLVDLDAMDWEGGQLQIGSEIIAYTINEDTEELTLATPLASSYLAEEPVFVYPRSIERLAYLLADDQEEELEARVPHALFDRLPLGVREETPTAEVVEAGQYDDELVVSDVIGVPLVIDGTFIDPDTLPPPEPLPPTDGLPPGSSPVPTVRGGIGSLVVTWAAIANADPVTYDVHLSVTNNFTPDTSSKAAEVQGTTVFLRTLPSGLALDYATTYYVKIVARDEDGSAAASAQGTGSPAQVNTPDIYAEAVTASKILADEALFDKLETLLLIANTLKVPGETGQRIEFDQNGIRLFNAAGDTVVTMDTQTGEVRIVGVFDFGEDGHLYPDDSMQLGQFASSGYQTPSLAQTANKVVNPGNHLGAWNFPVNTQPGNYCVIAVQYDDDVTITIPTGWSSIWTSDGGDRRVTLMFRDATTAFKSLPDIGFSGSGLIDAVAMEWSGVISGFPDTVAAKQDQTADPAVAGPAGSANEQAQELVLVAYIGEGSSGSTIEVPTGYTPIYGPGASIFGWPFRLAYKVVTAVETSSASADLTGPAMTWGAVLACFKAKLALKPDAPPAGLLKLFSSSDSLGAGLRELDSNDVVRSLMKVISDKNAVVKYGKAQTAVFGNTPAAFVNVAHGMGVAPDVVLCTPDRTGAGGLGFRVFTNASADAANIALAARTNNDSNATGSIFIWWLAIWTGV